MKREDQKQRFTLTLLVSLFVFAIITVAAGFAIGIIHLFLVVGVIDSFEGQSNLTDVIIFMSLISMVIGFLLTMLTGKISLKPVNQVMDHIDRLAKGDFKSRLKFRKTISSHPTFKEIETSFNRAAQELENTQMLRNDFINNFSHEFKTPIVSIAGFAKLLRHGNLSEEQKQEYLAVIEEESMRLADMATNVLSLTKVENQTILTDVSQFNLSEQIRSAVLLLADKWSQKNIDMDIRFGEYMIYANEELLKQVWINLIDNAIKFSSNDGKVSIRIHEQDKHIVVSIANNCKDIPKDSIDRIFNKFYQTDESHSSAGNGVGLAIVKKVVELHSGKVTVKSEDGLTTFTVKLSAFR